MTRKRVLSVMSAAAVLVVVVGLLKVTAVPVAAQSASTASSNLRTSWGDPDLQGIWNQVFNTPLERPAKYANREFFTDEERAQFDSQRAAVRSRDARSQTGTEKDVAGAYNAVFMSKKHTGARTNYQPR